MSRQYIRSKRSVPDKYEPASIEIEKQVPKKHSGLLPLAVSLGVYLVIFLLASLLGMGKYFLHIFILMCITSITQIIVYFVQKKEDESR